MDSEVTNDFMDKGFSIISVVLILSLLFFHSLKTKLSQYILFCYFVAFVTTGYIHIQ